MAIVRHKIIKLGVSYGSGCIKFGNDELAYCDALREFPKDGSYAAFREAYDEIDEDALAAAGAAAAKAEEEADEGEESENDAPEDEGQEPEAAEDVAQTEEPEEEPAADEPPEEGDAADTAALALIPFEIAPDDEEDEAEEEEEPEQDPTVTAAIEAGEAFKAVCSQLAFSELYEQMTAIIASLEGSVLPPVADMKKLDDDYNAIVEYVSHH